MVLFFLYSVYTSVMQFFQREIMKPVTKSINDAIKYCGGIDKLAANIGTIPSIIKIWKKKGQVSGYWAMKIEEATDNTVLSESLNSRYPFYVIEARAKRNK